MKLSNKTFIIIGATSGIGNALADKLSCDGASLVLCGRNATTLNLLAEKFKTKRYLVNIDVTLPSFEEDFSRELALASDALNVEKFNGGVYCPGIAPIMPLRGINKKTISDIFETNYTGAVLFSKVLASKRFRADSSSIILISSVSARAGEKGLGIYCASKAALEASAKAFARELAPFGVRINCVSPGWLDTNMNKENILAVNGLEEKMREAHPLGLGSASDVASAVAFLLSDGAKWITGTTVVVDGGFLS